MVDILKEFNCLRYSPSSRRLELLKGTKRGIFFLGEFSRNQTIIFDLNKRSVGEPAEGSLDWYLKKKQKKKKKTLIDYSFNWLGFLFL